ncbi:MAG: hypothetical protein SVY10_19155 [Thermodesulfobacteriota bacterium]|nr:hypothetical protein [Thermodesulfobacteriota bacterium]
MRKGETGFLITTGIPSLFRRFYPHLTSPIKGEEFVKIGVLKSIRAYKEISINSTVLALDG